MARKSSSNRRDLPGNYGAGELSSQAYKDGYDRIEWKPLPPVQPKPRDESKRADLSCPQVIGDSMDPTEHVDGRWYDSKSAYRAVTKANGMIEVGNDPARFKRPPPPKPDRAKIKEAVAKAVSRHL